MTLNDEPLTPPALTMSPFAVHSRGSVSPGSRTSFTSSPSRSSLSSEASSTGESPADTAYGAPPSDTAPFATRVSFTRTLVDDRTVIGQPHVMIPGAEQKFVARVVAEEYVRRSPSPQDCTSDGSRVVAFRSLIRPRRRKDSADEEDKTSVLF